MSESVVTEATLAGQHTGIPGLEGRHEWNGAVVLNDRSVWPRYKLNRITGLHSLGDPEDRRENAVGRVGELPRRSRRRGKTIVYEGQVQARSLADLRLASAELRAAFADQEAEYQMLVTHAPEYSDASYFFWARALQCEIPDVQGSPFGASMGFERDFAIGVRVSDPRHYDAEGQDGTTLAISVGGGIVPPVTPPFTPALPTSSSGAGLVENTGTAPTDPTVDIYGPVSEPVLMNLTYSLELAFTGLTLLAGEFVRVDFRRRTVLLNGVSDYRGKVDLAASDWWAPGAPGLPPGGQTIALTSDAAIADPAHAEISFYPAYW